MLTSFSMHCQLRKVGIFAFRKLRSTHRLADNWWPLSCNRRSLLTTTPALSLESLGQLQEVTEEAYEPGQVFIHQQFGYRGLILQAWPGKLYDRSAVSLKKIEPKGYAEAKDEGTLVNVYQVLTDQRDTGRCSTALKPGITFLPDDKRIFNTIYIVAGMDYVFHEDIIPYRSQDPVPIRNEYLHEFMMPVLDRDPAYVPTDHLRRWIETRKQSLEVVSVHREVTENIRTTTIPFFMGRRMVGEKGEKHIRYWRYLIRIENLDEEKVQLRERFWKVFSINGSLETVRGKGVVGMQPLLSTDSPVFQYHSHVQVPVPWAHMWGSFRFERPNGTTLDVKIPSFPLCDRAYWSSGDASQTS